MADHDETPKYSARQTLAHMFEQWRAFALFGDENALHMARHGVFTAFERNPGSVHLCLAAAFMHMCAEEYDTAQELLGRVNPYKGYYRANEPAVYMIFMYLTVCAENAEGRDKSARKALKAIEDGPRGMNGLREALLASLALEDGRLDEAFKLMEEAFLRGNNSTFLFVHVGRYLGLKRDVEGFHELIVYFAAWGARLGPDAESMMEFVLERYEENMSFYFFDDALINMYERVANAYPKHWLLRGICHNLIEKGDDSPRALEYYEQAQRKQVELEGLNAAVINAAYKHGMEDLSHYAVSRFLLASGKAGPVDEGLKVFLYHVCLCDSRFKDVVSAFDNDIATFAFYCVKNGLTGRRVNSVLVHGLMSLERRGIHDPGLMPYIESMEKQLGQSLFTYELTIDNPSVSHVWIAERERTRQEMYARREDGWIVRASNEDAAAICFSQRDMRVLEPVEAPVTFVKQVENASFELYMYFCRRDTPIPELRLAVARCVIEGETDEVSLTREERLALLNDALALSYVAHGFVTQINAAIGNILFELNDHDKALAYYSGVDDNYLDDAHIEQMLKVFMSAGEWEKAARLINKKDRCIPDRALFRAVTRLATNEELRPLLANAAYKLLLNSWYDRSLLAAALAFYRGSQQEWQELSKALTLVSATDPALDEMILRNSVWTHMLDAGAQRVFARMYEKHPENEYVKLFVYYCVYETLVNGLKPEYDTIAAMEEICRNSQDLLLAFALCTAYFKHGVVTPNSDAIINKTLIMMEKNDIMLPIFKNVDFVKLSAGQMEDKRPPLAYIVKNLPFIYRCQPDKHVVLHYRTDDDAEFSTRTMDYLRFGLYTTKITHFFAEKTTYYFSEEMATGSIVTKEYEAYNKHVFINEALDELAKDPYFTINNALVYEQMFKYEQVEEIITETLKESYSVRGNLL